jgi:hypothetical protein
MMGALGGTLTLHVASVAVPVLQRLLGTTPLGLGDWALAAAGSTAPPGRARDRQGRPRVTGPTRLAGQEDTSG